VNHEILVLATSLGWVGAVGTVAAYGLMSRRRLDAHSMRFQTINVVGAGLLAVSALSAGNWPSLVSNFVWMYFGLHTLVKARRRLAAAVTERWRGMRARGAVHQAPAVMAEPVAAASSDDSRTVALHQFVA
jgi:hypothetical protein